MLRFCIFLFSISACQSAYFVKNSGLHKPSYEYIDLLDTQNQNLNLKTLCKNHKGVVLLFWQSSCPCVTRYQARVNELNERYKSLGIYFVYVSSNTNESFEHVKKAYSERRQNIPLVRDEGAKLARALTIRGTPTAVLLDQEAEIAFAGWIDNERPVGERGRKAYLDDALKAHLNNEPILVKSSPAFGCPIR